jgi:predicted nucleic acid-binding protein
LRDLPQAQVAEETEIFVLIEKARLFGLGIGYVDAHLLASARLTDEARIWTRDKRLLAAAIRLGLAATDQ